MKERTSGSLKAPVAGLLVASLVAAVFVANGYTEMNAGGCDGGTCTVALVAGVVRGAIAWAIAFPVVWVAVALAQRASKRG